MAVTNVHLLDVYKDLKKRIAEVDIRQGNPGLDGKTGEKGADGADGKAGPRGPTGPSGSDGVDGTDGLDGLHGSHGRDGEDGVSITDVQIDLDGRLTVYLSDGTEIDAGHVGLDPEGQINYIAGGGVPDKYKKDLYDHIADLNNPHETALENLSDVTITESPPVVGTGIVWADGGWKSLSVWVAAGYGGIRQGAPVALPDLGVGWVTLLTDESQVTVPRAVTQDTVNNTLSFDNEGIWRVTTGFSLAHNEQNASRTIEIRFYNVTNDTAGVTTVAGIGRNTDVTTWSASFLLDIPAEFVGDAWRIEVSAGTDTVLAVTENSFTFAANLVSEFRG